MRWMLKITGFFFLFYIVPAGCMFAQHSLGDFWSDWHEKRWPKGEKTHKAIETGEAIIQVYAARAARWRGAFGVHTWFAVKRTDEPRYTRLEVMGFGVHRGRDAVRIRGGSPDAGWFGNQPMLLREIRGGTEVDIIIDRLQQRAIDYPYNNTYHLWPGPNSNTFTAYVARGVPELQLELPTNAIGKDYVELKDSFSKTPSDHGYQLSLKGYVGVMVGLEEGLEVNLLGLSAGIDLWPPALKLPAVGRLGFSDYKEMTVQIIPGSQIFENN